MSTEILLVSRAKNPDNDPRFAHAGAPAVHVELIEHSAVFDLVVNGVEVASSMTSTDLLVVHRNMETYLHGMNLIEDLDLVRETTPPQAPVLNYPRLDEMVLVLEGLVEELLITSGDAHFVTDTSAPGVDTGAIKRLLVHAAHLLEKRS